LMMPEGGFVNSKMPRYFLAMLNLEELSKAEAFSGCSPVS